MVHFDPVELAAWCLGRWQGMPPQFIAGVAHDSRAVQPGDLYVALKGERLDGHEFIPEAIQRSAGAALVDVAYAATAGEQFPLLVVEDTGEALTALARAHRQRCQAQVIGITGSVGKTSVKEMTADVLAHLGRVTRTHGNWNNQIGLPLSLLRMDPTDSYGVFEVGMNHPGELPPLCDLLQPDYGILTPVGPVHIEHFDSEEGIAYEKSTLLRSLPEQGKAILSLDDKWFDLLRAQARSKVILISMERPEADYYGEWQTENRQSLVVHELRTGQQNRYLMPLPGRYVADNALRAIAMGRELGLNADIIAHALATYQTLSMRWQTIEYHGVRYINDAYNANPISMRSAIEALQESNRGGRNWLVVAGMFELGTIEKQEHLELGHFIAQFQWAGVMVVGPLGKVIADGIREAGGAESFDVLAVNTHQDAAATLQERVREGEAVLLKASRGEHLERILAIIRGEGGG